jgi:hypothetical protein
MAEYTRFRDSILTDLRPVGVREQIAVDLIVLHYWRLRRVYRYETGTLRFELNKPAPILRSEGIKYKLYLLEAAYDELKRSGFIDNETCESLVDCYGEKEGSLARRCSCFIEETVEDAAVQAGADSKPADHLSNADKQRQQIPNAFDIEGAIEDMAAQLRADSKPTARPSNADENRQQILDAFDIEMETLEVNLGEALNSERLNSGVRIAILGLPREDMAERVLRHGTTIERQLYRAIAELEKLQRARRGQ